LLRLRNRNALGWVRGNQTKKDILMDQFGCNLLGVFALVGGFSLLIYQPGLAIGLGVSSIACFYAAGLHEASKRMDSDLSVYRKKYVDLLIKTKGGANVEETV
jgi:hypothetical protein